MSMAVVMATLRWDRRFPPMADPPVAPRNHPRYNFRSLVCIAIARTSDRICIRCSVRMRVPPRCNLCTRNYRGIGDRRRILASIPRTESAWGTHSTGRPRDMPASERWRVQKWQVRIASSIAPPTRRRPLDHMLCPRGVPPVTLSFHRPICRDFQSSQNIPRCPVGSRILLTDHTKIHPRCNPYTRGCIRIQDRLRTQCKNQM